MYNLCTTSIKNARSLPLVTSSMIVFKGYDW